MPSATTRISSRCAFSTATARLEKAIEIQTAYAKTAYEGFVAQATKMGELYADLAKESYKPFENFVGKSAVVK